MTRSTDLAIHAGPRARRALTARAEPSLALRAPFPPPRADRPLSPPIPRELPPVRWQGPVGGPRTLEWLRAVMPYGDWATSFPEIAEGLADACDACPIWDDAGGPARSVALLLSLAIVNSGMSPNFVGKSGQAFGLFQLRVPSVHHDATPLMVPRSAALIATDLLWQALAAPGPDSLEERLLWYPESPPSPADTFKARARVMLAGDICNLPQ